MIWSGRAFGQIAEHVMTADVAECATAIVSQTGRVEERPYVSMGSNQRSPKFGIAFADDARDVGGESRGDRQQLCGGCGRGCGGWSDRGAATFDEQRRCKGGCTGSELR
jgi:hypothetical protein